MFSGSLATVASESSSAVKPLVDVGGVFPLAYDDRRRPDIVETCRNEYDALDGGDGEEREVSHSFLLTDHSPFDAAMLCFVTSAPAGSKQSLAIEINL